MSKIVEIALSHLGYKEDPPNSNMTIFGKWFGLNGKSWCGMFASKCYFDAGYPLGTIDYLKGMAGCPFAVKFFTDRNEVVTIDQAQPGDLVFWDWEGNGSWDHVTILIQKLDSETFETIEGNTGIGNNSNGGEVMRRWNSFNGNITVKNLPGCRHLTDKTKVCIVHPKVLDAPAKGA